MLVDPAAALGSDGTARTRAAQLAEQAAEVRGRTKLKLPDAYAVATALTAAVADRDVRLESFDKRVVRAFAALRRTN